MEEKDSTIRGEFNTIVFREQGFTSDAYIKQIPELYLNKENVSQDVKILKCTKHVNLLQYSDYIYVNNELTIKMEACNFNLITYLQLKKSSLSVKELLRQAATGLGYLHSNQIYHGNLKPSNILIDSKNTVKLSDFGMHNVHHQLLQIWLNNQHLPSSTGWMAPEVLVSMQNQKVEMVRCLINTVRCTGK